MVAPYVPKMKAPDDMSNFEEYDDEPTPNEAPCSWTPDLISIDQIRLLLVVLALFLSLAFLVRDKLTDDLTLLKVVIEYAYISVVKSNLTNYNNSFFN